MLLCRKIGPKATQIIGGALFATGLLVTGFTEEAWQALITNGVITGI